MSVYVLDKALGETWRKAEIDYLIDEFGVEVEQFTKMPHRVVAMNVPLGNQKPICMTWGANCTIQEVEYLVRFATECPDAARRFDGLAGSNITDLIGRMIALAAGRLGTVVADLNGVEVSVKDGDSVEERWAWMQAEQERQRQAYIVSPEYKERCRLSEIEAAKDAADREAILAIAPVHMSLKDEAGWRETVEANKDDGYGACVIRYAEKWARFMEARVAAGSVIADCAEECSHLADDEGITGFMYGCAVSILAHVWIHGEELRRWHNKSTQIGSEGDEANETGGVLNPALLSFG